MPPKTLKNFSMLETKVLNALGDRTVPPVQSFFSQIFATNRWIHFDNDFTEHEFVILLLHFLVRYWPHRDYGRFFYKMTTCPEYFGVTMFFMNYFKNSRVEWIFLAFTSSFQKLTWFDS
jgi:hypothetical protein